MSRSLHFLLHMLVHKSLSLRQHAWLTGPGLGHLPCTSLAFSFAFSLFSPSLLSRFPSSCLSLARPRARARSLSLSLCMPAQVDIYTCLHGVCVVPTPEGLTSSTCDCSASTTDGFVRSLGLSPRRCISPFSASACRSRSTSVLSASTSPFAAALSFQCPRPSLTPILCP